MAELFGPQLAGGPGHPRQRRSGSILDHGYPLRLIAPNRAGVLNTKWVARIEVQ